MAQTQKSLLDVDENLYKKLNKKNSGIRKQNTKKGRGGGQYYQPLTEDPS